ncbi:MAG: 23S rRNA (uracil(1939)-C(5))-methyltransferase RlmD [Gammaproteobacteria bacterium]|nr:23S rRNA (uracil(1939)-C(5))-methyltransferase RlmD [Gammaproteobacteria bacterium]
MIKKVKIDQEPERTLSVTGFSHDGRGIGECLNKKTFIFGALPDETVVCKLTKKRSNYLEAKTIRVVEAAKERVEPICQHFGLCGGCVLQHMDTPTQLSLKQNTLLQHLKHFGQVEPAEVLPPLHATDEGYRHKARLGVRFVYKKNKLLIGFREKESRYLADIEECAVLHPRIGKNLVAMSQCIDALETKESIAQIEVAMGDKDIALVIRHLAPLTPADKEKLIEFSKMHHYQILLQPNPPAQLEQLWPIQPEPRLSFSLPAYQLTYQFHPLDFTQVNLPLNRLMVDQAIHLLDIVSTDRVLDLYCGIGNFTLPIARYAQEVVGIEGSEEMVLRGEGNATLNHISNVKFYAANLMNELTNAVWLKRYDKVLLDPPRTGAKELLPYFHLFAPKRIVYVSCNTATLARDAQILVHELGYTLQQAGIMNMFPHTAHIEAMAVFTKK